MDRYRFFTFKILKKDIMNKYAKYAKMCPLPDLKILKMLRSVEVSYFSCSIIRIFHKLCHLS